MAAQSLLSTRQALSTRSLKTLLQDLTKLYLANRTRISRTIYLALFILLTNRIRLAISSQKASTARRSRKPEGSVPSKKKVELNREFFRNVGKLLRICMPGWRSKEVRLLGSYSVFLVLRTLLSLYVAELDGRLVGSLVRGRGREFARGLVWWMVVAVPATFTNSMVGVRKRMDRKRSVADSGHIALVASDDACAAISHAVDALYSQSVFA